VENVAMGVFDWRYYPIISAKSCLLFLNPDTHPKLERYDEILIQSGYFNSEKTQTHHTIPQNWITRQNIRLLEAESEVLLP
jgi:hypothetical protein